MVLARFRRVTKAAALNGDGRTFHGLRASFITALEQVRVPLNKIESLVGHSRGALAYQTYRAGVTWERLVEDVQLVKYEGLLCPPWIVGCRLLRATEGLPFT